MTVKHFQVCLVSYNLFGQLFRPTFYIKLIISNKTFILKTKHFENRMSLKQMLIWRIGFKIYTPFNWVTICLIIVSNITDYKKWFFHMKTFSSLCMPYYVLCHKDNWLSVIAVIVIKTKHSYSLHISIVMCFFLFLWYTLLNVNASILEQSCTLLS